MTREDLNAENADLYKQVVCQYVGVFGRFQMINILT